MKNVYAQFGAPVEQTLKAFAVVEDFHFVYSYIKQLYSFLIFQFLALRFKLIMLYRVLNGKAGK
jgi:hypothetical protein